MAMRSFVVAGVIAAVLAVAAAAWWAMDRFGGASGAGDSDRIIITDGYESRQGSLYDEFGGSGSGSGGDGRITITTGDSLFTDDIFDRGRDSRADDDPERNGQGSASRFGAGPRFDWSGSGGGESDAPLSRETAADRVESDCRTRGGGAYACRCLVRMARQDLSEAEFEFLSLAAEPEPRGQRLETAGLAYTAVADLSLRLVALDAAADRRCGAGLTP